MFWSHGYFCNTRFLFIFSDINECSDSSMNECDQNADCTDTDGSYSCKCRTGFTGDGKYCNGITQYLFLFVFS